MSALELNSQITELFEPGLLEEIKRCKKVIVDRNTDLTSSGGTMRYTPIVLSGSIKVTRGDESGKEILMYHINPGESCIISITSCLKKSFGNMDSLLVTSEKDTSMILVSDQQIREWHDKYKSWRTFITDLYNLRLTDILSIVDAVAFKSVDQRLVAFLQNTQDENSEISLTHQEIANQIGTAREVISRLLKQLERDGKIELFRGKIKINSL
jgi:CRP/FNR family transcriptional regulator, anaerobic regulatory protein